jgi:hypothetical protein
VRKEKKVKLKKDKLKIIERTSEPIIKKCYVFGQSEFKPIRKL